MKLASAMLLGMSVITTAYAGGGDPAPAPEQPDSGPSQSGSTNTINHELDFDNSPLSRKIVSGSKTYQGQNERIFRDGLGREVTFRGFNVSGSVKLTESGFKPFRNTADAKASFDSLGQKAGSNIVRFTVAWEGIHTAPDQVDTQYLADIVAQMKEAIRNRMYVVVDYHSDLYSRHTFTSNSGNTGNGAPEWIVKGGNHGTDNCGIPCTITWGAYKLSDPAVRSAMRAFWLNSDISTPVGTRQVQDEFIWQIGETAQYIKDNLSADEFDYVLGIEPINEPFEAGLSELGLNSYAEFDNQMLWPFYERVRAEMNAHNWNNKWVYAEPMVFWSSVTGVVAPATGGGYLNYKPGDGFVFTPHFYDQGRQGIANLSVARNGTYFENIDQIRDEADFLDLPIMLSEFGMWVTGYGHTDPQRVVNATYQAMESSDRQSGKDRFMDFFTPVVSGMQWQWDYYYDNHNEPLNGDTSNIQTEDDAWNGEDYSVVNNYAQGYNLNANLIERIYPRRIQGDLMHFSYNALVRDAADALLDWGSIRVDLGDIFENREYFRGKKFAMAVWKGRHADAPTELFLPRGIALDKLLVITENSIHNKTLSLSTTPADIQDEVMLTSDLGKVAGSGSRLLIWDDATSDESNETIHFALVVEDPSGLSQTDLNQLQAALKQRIQDEKGSAVYMPNSMTHGGYPSDAGDSPYFALKNLGTGLCLDVAGARSSNGTNVQSYACNGTNAQKWFYEESTGFLRSALGNKCADMSGNFSNGANVQIWDCVNSNNLRFDFVDNTIRTRNNPNLAIDAFGSSNSSNVGLWSFHGGNNQRWKRVY